MTIPVTINLPDEVYQRADRFARLANRDLASIITDTFVSSLPPISSTIDTLQPVGQMSDPAVLELANSSMPESQDDRLSELLAKQREGELTLEEPQAGLVEAVKRGLMEPLG
jgi:hypothetical protein